MLPSSNRLKIPTNWSRKDPDIKLKTEFFKIIGKKNAAAKGCKIGFIISGKVGKATVRNRIRRVLANLFYPKIAEVNPNLELVLIAYPNISRATNEEISTSLNKVLPKLYFKEFSV